MISVPPGTKVPPMRADRDTHVVSFAPWEAGTFALTFQAYGRTDGHYGDEEVSAVGTLTVTVVAPAISFAAKPDASTTSTTARFEIASDSAVQVEYLLDFPPGQQHASPISVPGTTIEITGLAAGRHTIRVVAHDGVTWSALDYAWDVVGSGAPAAPVAPPAAPAPAPAAQPALSSSAIPAAVVARGVRVGATGESVAIIQRVVGADADGRFGSRTRAAVVAFQRARGLVADGIVGPLTWAAIVAAANGAPVSAAAPGTIPATQISRGIRQGARGASVVVLQQIVGADADGIFGPRTRAAIQAWQTAHGLVADGIVGPLTWAAMTAL